MGRAKFFLDREQESGQSEDKVSEGKTGFDIWMTEKHAIFKS